MKIGIKVKSTKNIYYVNRDMIYEDFYTQEEIMSQVSQIITEGDVYEFVEVDEITECWLCIEGSMLGEYSDGWFEMSSMIEKGVFIFTP